MSNSLQEVFARLPEVQSGNDRLYFHYYRLWRLQQTPDLFLSSWRNGQGVTLTVNRRQLGIKYQKVWSFARRNRTEAQTWQEARECRDLLPDALFVGFSEGQYKLPGISLRKARRKFAYQVCVYEQNKPVFLKTYAFSMYNDPYAAAIQAYFDFLGVNYPPDLFNYVVKTPVRGEDYLLCDPMAYICSAVNKSGVECGVQVIYMKDNGRKGSRFFTYGRYGDHCLSEATRFRDAAYGLSDQSADEIIIIQNRKYPKYSRRYAA